VGGALVVQPPEGGRAAAVDPLANRMNDNRSHVFLNVMMEDGSRWLADVGFGKRGPVYPVRVEEQPEAAPVDVPYTSVSNFRCGGTRSPPRFLTVGAQLL
jgi:arylamine N-acetyltransferase